MEAHNLLKDKKHKDDTVGLLQRIRQLEDINHAMAHNLRGAASNIKMLSEILIDREQEKQPAEAPGNSNALTDREALDYIDITCNAMLNTLEDMMDIVNNALNKKAEMVDCDVQQIVENVTHQLSGTILEKHARIVLHLSTRKIRYVKVYLESIVYNLVSNALKYSRPEVPLEVDITACLKNGRPILAIKDNGLGMDLEKINNRLFKLNQVFHNRVDSKGVGLYITKAQIESLGGSIDVKSKVNEGTEFIVML